MKKELIDIIDSLSQDELIEVRDYVKKKLKSKNYDSWNSKILISEVCTDYGLLQVLESKDIKNMEEFKRNGLRGIPISLHEQATWTLKNFDFTNLEKQYKKTK